MKVLKSGRKQTGWAVKKKCTGLRNGDGGCGAKLLVEEADVFRTESHARDDTTYFQTFECPECGVLTDFSRNEVPSRILPTLRSFKDWKKDHPGSTLEGSVPSPV